MTVLVGLRITIAEEVTVASSSLPQGQDQHEIRTFEKIVVIARNKHHCSRSYVARYSRLC